MHARHDHRRHASYRRGCAIQAVLLNDLPGPVFSLGVIESGESRTRRSLPPVGHAHAVELTGNQAFTQRTAWMTPCRWQRQPEADARRQRGCISLPQAMASVTRAAMGHPRTSRALSASAAKYLSRPRDGTCAPAPRRAQPVASGSDPHYPPLPPLAFLRILRKPHPRHGRGPIDGAAAQDARHLRIQMAHTRGGLTQAHAEEGARARGRSIGRA